MNRYRLILILLATLAGGCIETDDAADRTSPPGTGAPPPAATAEPAAQAAALDPDSERRARDSLVVLDGAEKVAQGRGAHGSLYVSYTAKEAYPADDALRQIASHLEDLGWRPLDESWQNPGIPSSHVRGWTEHVDATRSPVQRVHHWKSAWQDETGNLVDYSLAYSYPENGEPDLETLWVNAAWFPAATVRMFQTAEPPPR